MADGDVSFVAGFMRDFRRFQGSDGLTLLMECASGASAERLRRIRAELTVSLLPRQILRQHERVPVRVVKGGEPGQALVLDRRTIEADVRRRQPRPHGVVIVHTERGYRSTGRRLLHVREPDHYTRAGKLLPPLRRLARAA